MGKLVVTIGVGDQQGRQFEDLEVTGTRQGAGTGLYVALSAMPILDACCKRRR